MLRIDFGGPDKNTEILNFVQSDGLVAIRRFARTSADPYTAAIRSPARQTATASIAVTIDAVAVAVYELETTSDS
jgi:hypothetical protein